MSAAFVCLRRRGQTVYTCSIFACLSLTRRVSQIPYECYRLANKAFRLRAAFDAAPVGEDEEEGQALVAYMRRLNALLTRRMRAAGRTGLPRKPSAEQVQEAIYHQLVQLNETMAGRYDIGRAEVGSPAFASRFAALYC